jgi:hypothetical protein
MRLQSCLPCPGPRITILSASSGNGRCSAFASSHARHRREVADVAVDDAEEADDGFLVRGGKSAGN